MVSFQGSSFAHCRSQRAPANWHLCNKCCNFLSCRVPPPLCGTLKWNSSADYRTLRIGGLVFAVVLFTLGILLILSKITATSVFLSFCVIVFSTHIHSAVKLHYENQTIHQIVNAAYDLYCFQVEDAAAVSTRSKGKDWQKHLWLWQFFSLRWSGCDKLWGLSSGPLEMRRSRRRTSLFPQVRCNSLSDTSTTQKYGSRYLSMFKWNFFLKIQNALAERLFHIWNAAALFDSWIILISQSANSLSTQP